MLFLGCERLLRVSWAEMFKDTRNWLGQCCPARCVLHLFWPTSQQVVDKLPNNLRAKFLATLLNLNGKPAQQFRELFSTMVRALPNSTVRTVLTVLFVLPPVSQRNACTPVLHAFVTCLCHKGVLAHRAACLRRWVCTWLGAGKHRQSRGRDHVPVALRVWLTLRNACVPFRVF